MFIIYQTFVERVREKQNINCIKNLITTINWFTSRKNAFIIYILLYTLCTCILFKDTKQTIFVLYNAIYILFFEHSFQSNYVFPSRKMITNKAFNFWFRFVIGLISRHPLFDRKLNPFNCLLERYIYIYIYIYII